MNRTLGTAGYLGTDVVVDHDGVQWEWHVSCGCSEQATSHRGAVNVTSVC
jgi:hypothetical protein